MRRVKLHTCCLFSEDEHNFALSLFLYLFLSQRIFDSPSSFPHPSLILFLFLLVFFFRTSGKFGSNTEFTALNAFSAEKCLRPSPLQSKITQQPI